MPRRPEPAKRNEILAYIARYIHQEKRGPTLREIMQALDISTTSLVHHHLNRLEAEGRISLRHDGSSRQIMLPDQSGGPA